MSMVCGNAQSGDIIRLDHGLEWALEPKKMEYQETQQAGGAGPGDVGQAATNAAINSAASSAAANATKNAVGNSLLSSAASSLGSKLAGGLFKKKAEAPMAAESALPPGMVQAAQISIETTSINAAAVPLEQFAIPAGWKKVEPQAKDTSPKEFSCPTTGS